MNTDTTTDCYSPRTVWAEGFILTRAEGRTDDRRCRRWPVGRTRVRESLRQFDGMLRLVASKLERDERDEFGLTVVCSDGEQLRLSFDLDRDFHSLREHYPTLY
jgi:hypothetical protein